MTFDYIIVQHYNYLYGSSAMNNNVILSANKKIYHSREHIDLGMTYYKIKSLFGGTDLMNANSVILYLKRYLPLE